MMQQIPPSSMITPTTQQLLMLSYFSGANNHLGFVTAIDWQSDLVGSWLCGMQRYSRELTGLSRAFPRYSVPAVNAGMMQQWLRGSLFGPVKDKAQQAVLNHQDPDLFKQQDIDIETQYAKLTFELCELCFEGKTFSPERASNIFIDPFQSQQFYSRLFKMAVLEYQYHSIGLTRLAAQKQLLTSLLILITGTPASDPQPYRHYENDQPSDSFEEYRAKCQLRLEKLYQQQAFDLLHYSEHSADAKLGCCHFSVVPDSVWHGVVLRYYPCERQGADKKPVIYLSSPLINRAEIFDLAPGKSVIEGLQHYGHDVYLVDYSQAGDQDSGKGLDFFAKHIHDRYLALVKQRHPQQQIHGMGYCMGGTLFLTYLARRAEERLAQGLAMDITKLVLMATPVLFDDDESGHGPMRALIRDCYDKGMLSEMFDGVNIPPQLIEAGMHKIQPGVRYTVSQGFYERASFDGAIEDAAPFLNWLNHGTRFPLKAHQEWIDHIFLKNQIWKGEYCLPSTIPVLDGKPVNMHALTTAGVQLMDYRGLRDPISPVGSCLASETWGAGSDGNSTTTDGLNRTLEKNIGHIFVVSRKLLAEYLEHALQFYESA